MEIFKGSTSKNGIVRNLTSKVADSRNQNAQAFKAVKEEEGVQAEAAALSNLEAANKAANGILNSTKSDLAMLLGLRC